MRTVHVTVAVACLAVACRVENVAPEGAKIRCELDAAFFHLYGLSRNDTDYVMDTFPIVRKNDEKAHGEFRTKRVILEIYDAMALAAHSAMQYQTRLDPPPADPLVAHPDTRSGAT